MNIKLRFGDPYNDGHGRHGSLSINCNLNLEELTKAYDAGVKQTKIDIKKYCTDYEDYYLPRNVWENLIQYGFRPGHEGDWYWWHYYDTDDPNSKICLDDKTYAEIWLFIASIGNSNLIFEIIKFDIIDIGGYGLYS